MWVKKTGAILAAEMADLGKKAAGE